MGTDSLIPAVSVAACLESSGTNYEPGCSSQNQNYPESIFDAYTINEGQVGGGLQIRTADLDADGDMDAVVAGKDGTQILWNKR